MNRSNTATGGSLVLDPSAQDLLFRMARSANVFAPGEVSDAQIEAIYELIKYGPTSLNQQPLRIVLVRSDTARALLLRHLEGRNRRKTAAAPLSVILAADTAFHEHLPEVFPHAAGLRDVLDAAPVNRAAQARFNAALQIGYFIVGVRAAGLAAGPIVGFDAAGLDGAFFPDGRYESLLVVNIGRPAPPRHERLPRLSYHDVVTRV